jgi:hypothetical protein
MSDLSNRFWRAKAYLENIDELGKDADDGNERGELQTDQPRKFSIDFGESTIHVGAKISNRTIKTVDGFLILLCQDF